MFCKELVEENRSFWIDLKEIIFSRLARLCQMLRSHHPSFTTISESINWIFLGRKDTICRAFNSSVEIAELPPVDDIKIVHYDEHHPKSGRTQKFRLTLLDHITRRPIADELFDSKDSATIKKFLEKHL